MNNYELVEWLATNYTLKFNNVSVHVEFPNPTTMVVAPRIPTTNGWQCTQIPLHLIDGARVRLPGIQANMPPKATTPMDEKLIIDGTKGLGQSWMFTRAPGWVWQDELAEHNGFTKKLVRNSGGEWGSYYLGKQHTWSSLEPRTLIKRWRTAELLDGKYCNHTWRDSLEEALIELKNSDALRTMKDNLEK